MDPLSILGITSTALALAGRLGKTLGFLYQLSTKLKYADVKITLLIGYLGSLNAAITEIAAIVKGLAGCIQYQKLAESLNMTLDCTNLSLSFLDAKLDGLRSNTQDERSTADKITMIIKSSEFEDYVSGISCYVNALNLLLNALQSRSLLEQQKILNSIDADSIIEGMKDETSSLHCLADTASALSRRSVMSETSMALDASFAFDAEILSSKIYGVAYRSHLKQAMTLGKRTASPMVQAAVISVEDSNMSFNSIIRPVTPPGNVETEPLQQVSQEDQPKANDQALPADEVPNALMTVTKVKRHPQVQSVKQTPPSVAIEQQANPGPHSSLEGNAQVDQRQARTANVITETPAIDPVHLKMLLLGTSESGKSTILKGISLCEEGPYIKDERESFSEIIFSNLTRSVRVILEAMESLGTSLISDSDTVREHVLTVFMQLFPIKSMPPELCDAIRGLIHDQGFQASLKQRRRYQLGDNTDFYMQSLDRISASDYLPSDKDILYSWVKTIGITETTFSIKEGSGNRMMELSVYDLGGTRDERKKWIHFFGGVDMILFTVDIACYDQLLFEDETVNRMQEALQLFDSIVNCRWFVNAKVILCFTKKAKLAAKIRTSPVENYFSNFVPTEPPSLQDTIAYIVARFADLDCREGKLTDKLLTTLVLQDTLHGDEWQVIKEMAWELYDDKEMQSAAVQSKTKRQPIKASRLFRRSVQRGG